MAVGEESSRHMEVPDLENLSDELHNCFFGAEISFIVFPGW